MIIIGLGEAQSGMRLSRPTTNAAGVVLLEAGTTLTDPLITGLRNAGIESVVIAGAPDSAIIEELLTQLRARFAGSRNEPHMALLERVVAEHLEAVFAQ
jgi:hypothetical protein